MKTSTITLKSPLAISSKSEDEKTPILSIQPKKTLTSVYGDMFKNVFKHYSKMKNLYKT